MGSQELMNLMQQDVERMMQQELQYEAVEHEPNPYAKYKGVLNSSMSPYKLPSSPKFDNIYDIIGKKLYRAVYPQSFVPLPSYFTETGLAPFVDIRPIDDYAEGVLTIDNMVELTTLDIRWRLVDTDRIDEILDYIDRYSQTISPKVVESRPELKQYISSMNILREEMYRVKLAAINRHNSHVQSPKDYKVLPIGELISTHRGNQ